MSSAKQEARMRASQGVYDARNKAWVRVDHGTPDAVFADMDLRTGMLAPESGGDFYRENDCWKTLLRYVWHNARCMNEACAYFGFAALTVDPQYGSRMAQDELKFVRRGKFAKAEKVFGLGKRAVYRDWQALQGYTPISALLDGEQGEWAQDHEERERRRDALRAILRSAWQDLRTSKWTRTLRAAFANLTVIAAEDRALLAWITQTEFARGFVETRAAMCARRKRRVRVPLELNGYSGLTAPGGKSESAIATYSKVQGGNKNRAGAVEESLDALWEKEKARKVLREHSHIPRRPGLPTDPRALKAFLKREREAAELRRLTKLFPEIAGAELGKSDLETDNDHE